MAVVDKIRAIMDEQNTLFVDRAEAIRVLWLAVASRQHAFFLGIPGVSKTMLIEDLARRIVGANFFSYLMRKETTASEVFGPPSMSALRNDQFIIVTKGKLPEAHFGFLDEIWKSSSAALNGFLTIANERKFDRGDGRIDVPLISLFAASNELPQGEELAAIYDRFLLRLQVNDLEDEDFRTLLLREPCLNGKPTTVSLDEIYKLHEVVNAVKIPDSVKEKVVELRSRIRGEAQITFGPRRWLQGLSVVRANAVFSGRDEATEDDLEVYQHILWDTLEEQSKTRRVILSTINPMNMRFLELVDAAEEAYREVKKEVESQSANVQAVALNRQGELVKITKELKVLSQQASGTMKDRILEGYKKVRGWSRYVLREALGQGDDDF